MTGYTCPEWLRRRKITDAEYACWLEERTASIWMRERKTGKTAFPERTDLKRALHRASHESNGRDPYSGARFFVKHIRTGWTDDQAHLNGSRHYLTLRGRMPSFDHVRGVGKKGYELCTRETNSAKSYMSPAQFIDLCHRVVRHQADQVHSA